MLKGWSGIAHNQYTKAFINGTDPKGAKLNTTVVVKFGEDIPLDDQGVALLALERHLRALTKKDVRVFKDLKGDDSKLRVKMTFAQREKL
jgi:hypothetical protein